MSMRSFSKFSSRYAALAAVVFAGAFSPAGVAAQGHVATFGSSFELRPYVGAYIPTGDQRDLLRDAVFAGAQASWRLVPELAITGTFGWAPSKDRLSAGDQTLDLYQYDIGAEARWADAYAAPSWSFSPFAGIGIGGRTYDYRDLAVDSKTNVAGYGALGGELGFGRVGLRLEARDYVSHFEPLVGGGETKTRNDVTVAAGLTVRF